MKAAAENKQNDPLTMNPLNTINTLDLLHTEADGIHIILANVFRMLKPIRRKYRMTVNSIIVLNGIYLYHKYNSSSFTVNSVYLFIGYYNRPLLEYYLSILISSGFVQYCDNIKEIQYYKITELGISVIDDLNCTYKEKLLDWCNSHNVNI